MSEDNNVQIENHTTLEDLTLNEIQAADVKGGPGETHIKCGLIQKFSGGDVEGEVI